MDVDGNLYLSVYTTVITMTTVGYGDLSPRTSLGKIVAMIAALWGAFLISLMVLLVQNYF